ncbi:MAG: hypothetical protein EU539_07100 [Promethearchaeota archaeon]|nr:MAG: hypothetical protein EU539_07100 [Candidatus Lokiarchaeota archaeon]
MTKKDKCDICGRELVYVTIPGETKDLECGFCGKIFNSNVFCEDGHYICDSCHVKEPIKIIEKICKTTDIKDPFLLAEKIMKHPNFKSYGPEHHVLTPAVILTALKNNDIKKPNGERITFSDIQEAIRRASKIPGGWCGFYGSCGAGMGSGVAISIFTGADPTKNKSRTLANKMTSRSLDKIADNLEHCCKRSVKISICETLSFLKEKFDIDLDYTNKECSFSNINDKCEGIKCPFF